MLLDEMTLQRVCSQNRAEEFGYDVWNNFVVPLFYNRFDFALASKPRVIVGGRGCGKTMLLRYLSHHSTFSANRPSVPATALRHLGLYWKVDTNFVRIMSGRGLDEEVWQSAFSHYLGIVVARDILLCLSNIAKREVDTFGPRDLTTIRFTGVGEYDKSMPADHASLDQWLRAAERTFQTWCNNPRTETPPLFLPGKGLLLALIEDIRAQATPLRDCAFFVYIDEYENLRQAQQRTINTLLKHSEPPLMFNIAMKRNGMLTKETLGDESISDIADFRTHDLDAYLEEHSFDLFAAEIFFLRMATIAKASPVPVDINVLRSPDQLSARTDPTYRGKVIEAAQRIFPGVTQDQLASGVFEDSSLRGQLRRDIAQVLKERNSEMSPDQFLRQGAPQASIIVPALLHRSANEPSVILLELDAYEAGSDNRFTGSSDWIHNNFVGCLIHLYARYERPCPFYSGFGTFVALARANMRYFLELCHNSLKHVASEADPATFQVPIRQQAEAARQASAEFLREVRGLGRFGNRLHSFVVTLGSLFALAHRRPTQSEPEISHFAIKQGMTGVDAEMHEFLDEAVKWSVLFEERQTKVKDPLGHISGTEYVLHPIYAPYFHITFRKRRCLELSGEELRVLVNGIYEQRSALLRNYMQRWKVVPEQSDRTLFSHLEEKGQRAH